MKRSLSLTELYLEDVQTCLWSNMDLFHTVMKMVILDPSFSGFHNLKSISKKWKACVESCSDAFWNDLFAVDFGYLFTSPFYSENWKTTLSSMSPLDKDCSPQFRYVYLKNQTSSPYFKSVIEIIRDGICTTSLKQMIQFIFSICSADSWYKNLSSDNFSELLVFIDPQEKVTSDPDDVSAGYWYDSIQIDHIHLNPKLAKVVEH